MTFRGITGNRRQERAPARLSGLSTIREFQAEGIAIATEVGTSGWTAPRVPRLDEPPVNHPLTLGVRQCNIDV